MGHQGRMDGQGTLIDSSELLAGLFLLSFSLSLFSVSHLRSDSTPSLSPCNSPSPFLFKLPSLSPSGTVLLLPHVGSHRPYGGDTPPPGHSCETPALSARGGGRGGHTSSHRTRGFPPSSSSSPRVLPRRTRARAGEGWRARTASVVRVGRRRRRGGEVGVAVLVIRG